MSRISLLRRSATTVLAVVLLGSATAAEAAVGGFEGGDGDQASSCAATLDWACLASPAGFYDAVSDGVAPLDDVFVSSSKENDPDQWALTTGAASSPKSDIEAAWSAGASRSDAHLLEVAFKVAGGGSSVFVGVELNQDAQPYTNSTGSSVVCRRDGDLLISYAIAPNNLKGEVFRWLVDAGGPAACPGSKGHFEVVALPSAFELGLNSEPVANALAVDRFPAGSSFATDTFGEAAIDLDALAPSNGCTYFKRLQVTTRTSASTSATLDDVLPASRLATAACRREPAGVPAPTIGSAPTVRCVDSRGAVDLTGTGVPGRADLEVREVSGSAQFPSYTTRATNVTVSGDGTWSASLSPVGDGTHRYVVDYSSAAETTSSERPVVVSCSRSGDPEIIDDGSGGEIPAGPAESATTPPASTPTIGVKGARTCNYEPFRVSIRRPKARLVRFTVDGRAVGTVRRTPGARFAIMVDPLKFAPGAHTVRARILFRRASRSTLVKLRQFKSCSSRCANRRRFTIRLPKISGAPVVRAVVRVSGKRRRVLRGAQLTQPVRLRRLPKGRWIVDITMTTADDRVVRSRRVYRTCSGRITQSKPGA